MRIPIEELLLSLLLPFEYYLIGPNLALFLTQFRKLTATSFPFLLAFICTYLLVLATPAKVCLCSFSYFVG